MYRRRESNFVAPLPEPKRVEIVEMERELPATPTPVLLPKAGYRDRAEGFTLATAPLAASVGLVVALVAVIGWQVPIASLVTLLLALGGFCVTWLAAYAINTIVSPDGALFAHTFWTWRYLKREQAERHARLRRLTDRES